MNQSNPPGDSQREDTEVTEIPQPEAVRTRQWNTAKVDSIRARLEDAGIEFTDHPTDEWIRETERKLNRDGDPILAREMKAAVIRLNPVARPLGREQQEKTRRAADAQKRKEARGTTVNERGQRVHRKYPVTMIVGAAVLGALLLGGLVYGGVSEFKKSSASAAARREKAQQQAAATQQINQVDVADPNAVVDPDRAGDPNGQVDAGGAIDPTPGGTSGSGTSAQGSSPGGGQGAPPTEAARPVSAPPDSASLREQYNQGKRDGAAAGYSSGAQEGYTRGRQEGQQAGQQAGVQQGYRQGQQEGYVKGKQDGQQEGYKVGLQQGAQGSAGGTQPVSVVAVSPVPTSQSGGVSRSGQPAAATAPAVPGRLAFTGAQPGDRGSASAASAEPRLTFAGAGGAAAGGDGAGAGPTSGASSSAGRGNFTMQQAPAAAGPSGSASSAAFQLIGASGSQGGGAAAAGNGQMLLVTNPATVPVSPGDATATGAAAGSGQEIRTVGGLSVVMPGSGGTSRTGSAGQSGQSGTPGGAAPTSAAPFGPYRPYQTINARLQTATLVMDQGKFNLPVIAVSSDGRKWVGVAAVGGAQRVYLTFTQLIDTDNSVLNVPAAAYDATGTPGIQGSGQDLAPDLARNLLRNAATGVRDFAQGQLNASRTTVQPNGNVVVEKAAPNLWTMVGSRALSVFDLPANQQTFTRATYLPAGTPIVLMVGAGNQQAQQP